MFWLNNFFHRKINFEILHGNGLLNLVLVNKRIVDVNNSLKLLIQQTPNYDKYLKLLTTTKHNLRIHQNTAK